MADMQERMSEVLLDVLFRGFIEEELDEGRKLVQ